MAMSSPCPVCASGVYTQLDAPMSKMGTVNPARHSCVKNGTWKDKTRFGGSVSRLRDKLIATPEDQSCRTS